METLGVKGLFNPLPSDTNGEVVICLFFSIKIMSKLLYRMGHYPFHPTGWIQITCKGKCKGNEKQWKSIKNYSYFKTHCLNMCLFCFLFFKRSLNITFLLTFIISWWPFVTILNTTDTVDPHLTVALRWISGTITGVPFKSILAGSIIHTDNSLTIICWILGWIVLELSSKFKRSTGVLLTSCKHIVHSYYIL